jgi:hypothetical protein
MVYGAINHCLKLRRSAQDRGSKTRSSQTTAWKQKGYFHVKRTTFAVGSMIFCAFCGGSGSVSSSSPTSSSSLSDTGAAAEADAEAEASDAAA